MVYCYKNTLGHYSFKVVASFVHISWSLVVKNPQNITTSSVSFWTCPRKRKSSINIIITQEEEEQQIVATATAAPEPEQ